MKYIRYILLFSLLLGRAGAGLSQDYARVCERSILGTARYMGMGGAMSAVGGDPSAVHDNPAGLGLYQRAEILFSIMGNIDRTQMLLTPETKRTFYHTVHPHASVVFCFPSYTNTDKGILFNNLMFSYQRLQTYGRTLYGFGKNGRSLGALIADADVNWDIDFCSETRNKAHDLSLEERGGVHEFSFNWAMNISHKWYVGAGLQMQSLTLNGDAEYDETFDLKNAEGRTYFNRNITKLIHSGMGASLSAGMICRPMKWLRLGVGLQTPGVGYLDIFGSGKLEAQADTFGISYGGEGRLARMPMIWLQPLHASASVAFQFGAYGMASLQYDIFYRKEVNPIHSLRAGIEVIPVLGMYINAGYACESSFRKDDHTVPMDPTFDRQDTYYQFPQMAHYVSFALGYRGRYAIVQAAYQYRWQNLHLYAHENAHPFPMHADTHRIVLTVGWHRY